MAQHAPRPLPRDPQPQLKVLGPPCASACSGREWTATDAGYCTFFLPMHAIALLGPLTFSWEAFEAMLLSWVAPPRAFGRPMPAFDESSAAPGACLLVMAARRAVPAREPGPSWQGG